MSTLTLQDVAPHMGEYLEYYSLNLPKLLDNSCENIHPNMNKHKQYVNNTHSMR